MEVLDGWAKHKAEFKADTGLDLDGNEQTFVNWEGWKLGQRICACGESEVDHNVPMGPVIRDYFGPGQNLRFGGGSYCYIERCKCDRFRPVDVPPWLKRTS